MPHTEPQRVPDATGTEPPASDCGLPQYGPQNVVLAFGLDGDVWGVRELYVYVDGAASYVAHPTMNAVGANLPAAHCAGRIADAELDPLRQSLEASRACATPQARVDGAWTATLCVVLDDGICRVHRGQTHWRAADLQNVWSELERLAALACGSL